MARRSKAETVIGCVILDEGRAHPFTKESVRTIRPFWDLERCTKCGVCYLFCPDAAVVRDEDGYFDMDPEYCKGCGICHQECWFGAIEMVEEN
jgi:pyruvate ferredoxin oxidoreductase delta subunit